MDSCKTFRTPRGSWTKLWEPVFKQVFCFLFSFWIYQDPFPLESSSKCLSPSFLYHPCTHPLVTSKHYLTFSNPHLPPHQKMSPLCFYNNLLCYLLFKVPFVIVITECFLLPQSCLLMYVCKTKAHPKITVENPFNSSLIAKTWHVDTQKPSINVFCFSVPLSFGLPVSGTM